MSACWWCGNTGKNRCRCGAVICDRDTHYYVDGQNRAIIASARGECPRCAGVVLRRPFTELQAELAWEW